MLSGLLSKYVACELERSRHPILRGTFWSPWDLLRYCWPFRQHGLLAWEELWSVRCDPGSFLNLMQTYTVTIYLNKTSTILCNYVNHKLFWQGRCGIFSVWKAPNMLCGRPTVIQITNAKKAFDFLKFFFSYNVVLGLIWVGKNFTDCIGVLCMFPQVLIINQCQVVSLSARRHLRKALPQP